MREPVQSSEQPRDHDDASRGGYQDQSMDDARNASSSRQAEELERELRIRRSEERGEVL